MGRLNFKFSCRVNKQERLLTGLSREWLEIEGGVSSGLFRRATRTGAGAQMGIGVDPTLGPLSGRVKVDTRLLSAFQNKQTEQLSLLLGVGEQRVTLQLNQV